MIEIIPDQRADFDGWLCWKLGINREELKARRESLPDYTARALGLLPPRKKPKNDFKAPQRNDLAHQLMRDAQELKRQANARKARENRERWLNDQRKK